MHLADFLGQAAPAHPALHAALAALPPFPPDARCLLLTGPERSGKTSLLFHAALCAARRGQSVLLLCRRCAGAACRAQGGARPATTPLSRRRCIATARSPQRCCRRKLEEAPPLLPEGVALEDPAWQRVAIKYIASGAAAAAGSPPHQHASQRQPPALVRRCRGWL